MEQYYICNLQSDCEKYVAALHNDCSADKNIVIFQCIFDFVDLNWQWSLLSNISVAQE